MVQNQDESMRRSGTELKAAEEGISHEFVPGAIKEKELGWYL